MGKIVLKDAYFRINSTTLTDHVQSITVNYSAADVDKTAMTDDGIARLAGLYDWSLDITFLQDFDTGEVDATIAALVGTTVAVYVRPTTGGTTATNPQYTGTGIIFDYTPVTGTVGDLATAPVSVKCSDGEKLTRSVS